MRLSARGCRRSQKQTFADIWDNARQFSMRCEIPGNLKGKCGCCEFRNVCMGCRARAYRRHWRLPGRRAFCVYQPRTKSLCADKPEAVGTRR